MAVQNLGAGLDAYVCSNGFSSLKKRLFKNFGYCKGILTLSQAIVNHLVKKLSKVAKGTLV